MSTFDDNVQFLLQTDAGIRPAQTQKKKSQCTPMEWAQKLKYQKEYYEKNTPCFRIYQRRWECKQREVSN